jgi:hypothetical protein
LIPEMKSDYCHGAVSSTFYDHLRGREHTGVAVWPAERQYNGQIFK